MRVVLLILLFLLSLSAKDLEKVSLQLQWLDQFQFAGYYMAKERGYYKEEGLDVTLKEFKYGLSPLDEVITKRVTYAIGRSSLIVQKAEGKDIKLISAIFQSSPLVMLATKDSNITSIEDVRGKRVMATSDAIEMVSINAMLNQHGIGNKDITITQSSFNLDDLVTHKTDLMLSYVSNEPFILQERGVEYEMFNPKDHGFDFYSDILFTSGDEVKNNRDRVSAFKRASLKGWEYAFENIQESVDIIYEKYNSQKKSKKALLYEAQELKKLAYYKNIELGFIDKHKIERIYDIYNVMGIIEKETDMSGMIFTESKDKSINLTQEEDEYLKNKKEITVCVKKDWLPFESLENGKFIGMSADFLNLYASKLGVSLKIIKKEGRCHLKPMMGMDVKKAIPYKQTEVYMSDSMALVTRIEQPFIADLSTLREKKIIVSKGFSRLKKIFKNHYPKIKIEEVQDINIALELIAKGKAFGYIGTSLSSSYAIQKSFADKLKIVNDFESLELGVGVIESEPLLLSILNKTIKSTTQEEKNSIYSRWVAVMYEKEPSYIIIWQMLGGFILVLSIGLFFLVKQNRLKEELKELNETLEKKVQVEITKNHKKEQLLLQQSRLAQMGEMISMIAHQWRQPLGSISTTAVNLKLKLELEAFDLDTREGVDEASEYFLERLDNIEKYVYSLTTTIDDFRNFYKPNKESTRITLQELIKKALSIIEASLLNDNIEIVESYEDKIEFEMYDGEMTQVILNILKNAQDNFKEKPIENAQIIIKISNGVISICDNGGGVPTQILGKIFDPYFSTKDEKNGTGLGLYMSKIIVQEHHNGTLNVLNKDAGACFEIEIGSIKC